MRNRTKRVVAFIIAGIFAISSAYVPEAAKAVAAAKAGASQAEPAIHIVDDGSWEDVTVDGITYTCNTDTEDAGYGTAIVSKVTDEFKSSGTYAEIKNEIECKGKLFPVVAVGADATFPGFEGCTALEKVVIPDGVTKIGARAFAACPELVNVEIPQSVTEIGEQAFNGDSRLKDIELPENITQIKELTFNECYLLGEIEIPQSVTKIASTAFDTDVPLIMYGCIGSAAEKYADKNSNIIFKPVNGLSNDYFRMKFHDTWVGKYVAVYVAKNRVEVYSQKCYEENQLEKDDIDGGLLFSVAVDAYEESNYYADGINILKKDGGQTYFVYWSTKDPENIDDYGYSPEAVEEYKIMHSQVEDMAANPNLFKILHKANKPTPTIKSIKNIKGKKVKITLKSKVKGATGYEYQYGLSPEVIGKTGKTTTKKTITFSKLKKGKNYYFRVRNYVKYGSIKIYGKWSSLKKVKIKK